MICLIDNKQIQPELIFYRELGFGQEVGNSQLFNYEIQFAEKEFVELIKDGYVELLEDQRRDQELTGEPEPPFFPELGYPPIEVLITHSEYFSDAIKDYLYIDLFNACFTSGPEIWKWIINSIDSVEVVSKIISIRGEAVKN